MQVRSGRGGVYADAGLASEQLKRLTQVLPKARAEIIAATEAIIQEAVLAEMKATPIAELKDFVQAVKWWRQASERGDVLSQYYLGGCYANGEGVAKDQIEAYAYWNQGTVEYARKKLAALEKQMTPEQIAAGKKRTKELKRELEDKIYENARQKEFAAKIAEKPDGK